MERGELGRNREAIQHCQVGTTFHGIVPEAVAWRSFDTRGGLDGADPPWRTFRVGALGSRPFTSRSSVFTVGRMYTKHRMRHPQLAYWIITSTFSLCVRLPLVAVSQSV